MTAIQIEVPAIKQHLEYIDKVVESALFTLPVEDSKAIHFAVHEVVINAIQAYERQTDIDNPNIQISMEFENEYLNIAITDHFGGMPINLQDFSSLTEDELLKNDGRGILLISHLVDDYYFESGEEQAFTVNLIYNIKKRLSKSNRKEAANIWDSTLK